jgi:hypothetical protein
VLAIKGEAVAGDGFGNGPRQATLMRAPRQGSHSYHLRPRDGNTSASASTGLTHAKAVGRAAAAGAARKSASGRRRRLIWVTDFKTHCCASDAVRIINLSDVHVHSCDVMSCVHPHRLQAGRGT